MKLINKAAVIAEIERRIRKLNEKCGEVTNPESIISIELCKIECKLILNIINTLEVKEVDLEKEIELVKGDYEQVDVAWNDEHSNNPYKDVIEHMSSNAYRVWKENLWHDAQGENLPPIDREVIVLCDDGHGGYKVCFGHRPVERFTGISITNHSEMEEYYPERYGKGEWNIPNVKWWLDVELPYIE